MPRDIVTSSTVHLRDALRKAIRTMDTAKDTGNRAQYSQARAFFKQYWRLRHTHERVSI